MNIDLKPCPFCGKKIKKYRAGIRENKVIGLHIECDCFATIDISIPTFYADNLEFDSSESAVDVWNRRDNES